MNLPLSDKEKAGESIWLFKLHKSETFKNYNTLNARTLPKMPSCT